ncbi:MAG: hypothetical protein FJ202_08130 [Gemmatimonadetes bacterium]|nr:hypothetical protein [Gemmatimonadota bacterium]
MYGIVAGDAVARGGDIVVHRGGLITGNAVAIAGRVRFDGGTVRGAVVTLDDLGPATAPLSPRDRALRNLTVVGVSALILLVIGLGVVANASDNLQAVADALERQYGRSLIAGLAGQAAFLPLLVVICLALVLSVIGILLVPFAAVVYGIVAAGLVTIGLLATAVVIGRGWRAAPVPTGRSQKAATVRAMALGIGAISAPFAAAALFAPWPQAEPFARATAIAAGWVACTAGLGAAIVSRAGIRRIRPPQLERALATASWQTPTPVTGVAAARRPAAMPTPSRPQ